MHSCHFCSSLCHSNQRRKGNKRNLNWERRCKAAGLKARADQMRISNPEVANSILREAAEIFDAIGKADSAARCFCDLGEYERAGIPL